MFGIRRKGDPLYEVVKRYKYLEKDLRHLARAFAQNRKNVKADGTLMILLDSHLKDVSRSVRILEHERKTIGCLAAISVSSLSSSFIPLKEAARELDQGWVTRQGIPPSGCPPLQKIHQNINKLDSAIRRLMEQAAAYPRPTDMETDPFYEEPRKLREAIHALDKRAAKNLKLQELDRWFSVLPAIDWHNPLRVRRVAKIYLLSQEPFQVWEVRYRSDAPGRPLVLLIETVTFPDLEFLAKCDETYGFHEEYYIAARIPCWRIVWKSSWNDW